MLALIFANAKVAHYPADTVVFCHIATVLCRVVLERVLTEVSLELRDHQYVWTCEYVVVSYNC